MFVGEDCKGGRGAEGGSQKESMGVAGGGEASGREKSPLTRTCSGEGGQSEGNSPTQFKLICFQHLSFPVDYFLFFI